MKRVLMYVLAGMIMVTSCSKDEQLDSIFKPDSEKQDQIEADSDSLETDVQVSASIRNLQESRSTSIDSFVKGHEMGVYVGNKHSKFVYDGMNWTSTQTPKIHHQEDIYAYFPFKSQDGNQHDIAFDLVEQPDILWSRTVVTPDFPMAKFEMEHKLSLVRIRFLRDEYMGEGVISNVTANDYNDVHLNYSTGTITVGQDKKKIVLPEKYILDDTSSQMSEFILSPRSKKGDPVQVSFLLDGKEETFYLPDWHEWEAGKIYTYSLKLKSGYNTEVHLDDVPIDEEYWGQYGKTDDIVFKEPAFDDFERYMVIESNYTKFGYDCYQNEGKVFGVCYTHYGSNLFQGNIRFILTQNGQIVEKFPPKEISVQGNWRGLAIPCYVTSQPGNYQLEPIFQKEGETTWFHGHIKGNSLDWTYEILPPAEENLPSLRDIVLEDVGVNEINLTYPIPFETPFNVVYTLSNRGKSALKGEIKAVWEREFKAGSNTYFPDARKLGTVDDNEWNDEIGRIQIDIKPGIRFWKGSMECKVTRFYPNPIGPNGVRYAVPTIHLYWKAEGSKEWKLLRLDADFLFNRDYEGDVWNETKNFLSVYLDEWNQ